MKTKRVMLFFMIYAVLYSGASAADLKTPEEHFGYRPGADRMLLSYDELIDYLKILDQSSPMLKMVENGVSPLGRTMYICFISDPDNIRNLDKLKEINRRLALEPQIPASEKEAMISAGKVFFLATLSMHSGEVAPAQSLPLIAHKLLTSSDPLVKKQLQDVVLMFVPNHNPDGMDMVVNHYRKYKGTKYEGSSLPGVYHKYVGHDNNRDFITLSQSDTKAIARIYNLDWFPQVMVEKHQMGSTGPRYFVPPNHDPIAENIDAELWNWTGIMGSNLMKDMTKAGLAGVSQHYLFDDYWPGSTETCIWKNVIGFLTEAASVKYATPVYVEPNELRVSGKGLSEYKKSINMPLPWEGGWWRLSDIVEYEIVSMLSGLKTASLHRSDILKFRNDMCVKEIEKGYTIPPYYYVLPIKQHDQSELAGIVNLLREHGVDVFQLTEDKVLDEHHFNAGDIVVPLAQPFRAFIKEVMEYQKFPLRHYTPGGEIIRPYDITSWSLPLHRNVRSVEVTSRRCKDFEVALKKIDGPFRLNDSRTMECDIYAFPSSNNESYKAAFHALAMGLKVRRTNAEIFVDGNNVPAGSFIIQSSGATDKFMEALTVAPVCLASDMVPSAEDIRMPRIALVESYFHDMDAGWTRFVFDSYHIPFTVIRPGQFKQTDFAKRFDIVVFPDESKNILMEGKYKGSGDDYYISSYPPEYTKGIGKEGMASLMTFMDKGGIIVSWGRSTSLFMKPLSIERSKKEVEEFRLPINDISANLQKDGLYCPGSLVKVHFTKGHPLTLGMPDWTGVFYRGRPVFTTSLPKFDMDRRVIGKFPEEDILLSGYCEEEEKLANRSVMVWLRKGKGQLVLLGFQPQFRASTQGTFKLLFNSILLPKI